MKSKADVLQAVKQFAKEIGAPDALICDAAKAQTSKDMRKYCNEIGTTLRALEEGTPWANKAELYIGLLKEAVRKDMKSSNSPFLPSGTTALNGERELIISLLATFFNSMAPMPTQP
jgi:predicted nuclease of restriction endonuclease-like RecB superfamily